MSYDQITKDLCRKAQDDCHAAVTRTASLLVDPTDKMFVAISATAGCFASAAGYVAAITRHSTGKEVNPAAATDALWEIMRPIILGASGGDRAPLEALLADLPA